MFNLFVKAGGWSGRRDEMPVGRTYIRREEFPELFGSAGELNLNAITQLPALFVAETDRFGEPQFARVATLNSITPRSSGYSVQYSYEMNVPPIPQADVHALAGALNIPMATRGFTPLEHTHWRICRADLYKVLATEFIAPVRSPTVFDLNTSQLVEPDLLSTMMPFGGFDHVWEAIQRAGASRNMRCGRADNSWEHAAIIQDVVDLIDRSSVVICDCSTRNPNVFYEMGIAHALGKEVIITVQNRDDIPFDIRHLRHIQYMPNAEGLAVLQREIESRLDTLLTRR